jgi:hypothetical protein
VTFDSKVPTRVYSDRDIKLLTIISAKKSLPTINRQNIYHYVNFMKICSTVASKKTGRQNHALTQ